MMRRQSQVTVTGQENETGPEPGRRGREGALKLSEERFRAAFRASPEAVGIIRLGDYTYVDVNESFSAFTGFAREELIGRPVSASGLWQEVGGFPRLVAGLKKMGPLINTELSFRDRLGRVRSGSVSAMVMGFEGEQHLLVVIRDLDLLKKTEEALASSEARFRELFNNMSSGVAILEAKDEGLDFLFLDFNRAAERIEGVRRRDVVGRTVMETFPSIEKVGLLEVFRRVWATGQPERFTVTAYRRDMLRIWKENYVYRLPSGEIIVVYDDITGKKRAEEKLLAYQEQLRSLGSELTLAEERERRRIARDLHDEIGQTLSVIKMRCTVLREQLTEAPALELDGILDLLDLAIKETRSLTSQLSPPVLYELGLEAAVEWLLETFQAQHGLRCEFVNDGLAKPMEEEVQVVLFRAVRELLVNIVKHAATGTARVEMAREADLVRIVVEDRGAGFDVQATTSGTARNHEFGLFNIRERLGHLGGRLELTSAPGRGTRAILRVPLKREEESR